METEAALVPAAPAALASVALDRHPAAVYLARLAPLSRATMSRALDAVAQVLSGGQHDAAGLAWADLRYRHIGALRSRLAETCAPATANLRLAAVRGVLREAFRLGQLGAEDYHRAIDVERVKGERLPAGRGLGRGEIEALFRSCAEDPHATAGARNAVLLLLLYGCGLRRAEAAALDLDDFDGAEGTLRVRAGKGRKDRLAHVPAGGLDLLVRWIELRGSKPGPLLQPVNKGGRVIAHRLTPQAIYNTLVRLAATAQVKRFSPHDLRRSFVGDLLDAGADLAAVQALAGHASPVTTARYDRRGERAKKRAADLLLIPVSRPAARTTPRGRA